MTSIEKLKKEVESIKARNKKVEAEKAPAGDKLLMRSASSTARFFVIAARIRSSCITTARNSTMPSEDSAGRYECTWNISITH